MILIVDDDSAIRSSLSFMLKRAKYEVKAVSGPKEAIEADKVYDKLVASRKRGD